VSVAPRRSTPALLQIDAILGRLRSTAALAEVCRFLHQEFAHYGWIGVYRVEGAELVLEAWDGPAPTEHVRIPLGRGLCGRAARENRSVVVPDVREEPDYLACFRETRAEIVVPVREEERAVGEIDVDGITVGAFDASDDRFLTDVARRIAPALRDARAGAEATAGAAGRPAGDGGSSRAPP
jgi:L-methionine (R)-S-oxide reductase